MICNPECTHKFTIMECKYCKQCKHYFCPLHSEHPHKPHIFTIEGYQTYVDWADYKPYKVDEFTIWGFELYWRGGGDWFVQVVPKKGEKYYVGHGTHRLGISQLLANPHASILGIFNDKGLEGFMEELQRVMPKQASIKKQ